MCIAVIVGMKRLAAHYWAESQRQGIELKVFNVAGRELERKLQRMDVVILFTDQVSHNARSSAACQCTEASAAIASVPVRDRRPSSI